MGLTGGVFNLAYLNMARVDTNIADLLEAIQEKLIEDIDRLNESNCIISQRDQAPQMTTGQTLVQISIGAIPFEEALWHGGERFQVTGSVTLGITVFNTMALDQPSHDKDLLLDKDRGLLPWVDEILNVLAAFEPENKDADRLLREPLQPLGISEPAHRPEAAQEHDRGIVDVNFLMTFDWDLS